MLKEQLFGVEVEMTGISRKTAANVVAEVLGTEASRPSYNCYRTRTIEDSKGRIWKIMRDSSIHPICKDDSDEALDEYRVEFVTPPLHYEDGRRRWIKRNRREKSLDISRLQWYSIRNRGTRW